MTIIENVKRYAWPAKFFYILSIRQIFALVYQTQQLHPLHSSIIIQSVSIEPDNTQP